MNKLLLGLGALLLWKIFKLEEQVKSSEAAVTDIMMDMDNSLAANIQETAHHIGLLYNENHYLGHQIDLLSLDYLHHLSESGHWDIDNSKIIQLQPYVVGTPSPTELEIEMRSTGLEFETRRIKGL